MVTNNSSKYPPYTYKKGRVFYYSRTVPEDIIEHYSRKRIVASLRTTSYYQARIMANDFSSKLEKYWLGIRLQKSDIPALQLVKSKLHDKESSLPTIIDAKELYFDVKGRGKPKLFFDIANRNIRYLIECLGVSSVFSNRMTAPRLIAAVLYNFTVKLYTNLRFLLLTISLYPNYCLTAIFVCIVTSKRI